MIVHDEWNECKLVRQVYDSRAHIDDAICMFFVHGKYIVEVIRRYKEMPNQELDFRSRREFMDLIYADYYFDQLKENPLKR